MWLRSEKQKIRKNKEFVIPQVAGNVVIFVMETQHCVTRGCVMSPSWPKWS
jgi:hypothetical protein